MEINAVLEKYPPLRENILNLLHEIQSLNPLQYLSEEVLEQVSEYMKITRAEILGVVEYYSMLSTTPRAPYLIRVCHSPICRMLGGQDLLDLLRAKLSVDLNEPSPDGLFYIETTECLGNCHRAPSMMLNDRLYSRVDSAMIDALIDRLRQNIAGNEE